MKCDFKIIRTCLTIKYCECVFGGYRDFNGIVKNYKVELVGLSELISVASLPNTPVPFNRSLHIGQLGTKVK